MKIILKITICFENYTYNINYYAFCILGEVGTTFLIPIFEMLLFNFFWFFYGSWINFSFLEKKNLKKNTNFDPIPPIFIMD